MWRVLTFSILTAAVALRIFAQSPGAPTTYTVTAPGYVSAVVRAPDGRIVRTAFTHRHHVAGTHAYTWDGFDDDGRQAPNGSYQLRTVWTPGFVATFRAMTGTSLGLGQMPGNHRPIESLAIGDSPYLLIASHGDNTSPFESCLTKDGSQRLAEGQRFTGGRVAATTRATTDVAGETDVWYDVSVAASSEAGILRKNQLRAMNREGIYKCEWNIRLSGQTAADWHDRRYSIAALGDVVVLGYQDDSLLRFFDCTRKETAPAGILPPVILHSFAGVTEPIDVALQSATAVLVTTRTSVLRYDRSTGQLTTVVSGLTGAGAIDINRTTGDFYVVVNNGTQVRRYAQNGALRATYGPVGGRKSGAYDPRAFAGIRDVASDQANSFWVAEEFPRRVTLFRDDGTHVRDLFGPQGFYNASAVDPVDPQRLWVESPGLGLPHIAQASLNLLDVALDRATWEWSVRAVRTVPRAVGGDHRERWQCHRVNGARYFTLGSGYTGSLVVRESASGELILTNVFYGCTGDEAFRFGMTADEKSRADRHWNFVYTNSRAENSYLPADYEWSDVVRYGWDGFFDGDLNFFFWDGYTDNKLYRLARTGWNQAGAPTYGDFSDRVLVIDPGQAGFRGNIRVHRWLKLSDGGFAALIQAEDRPHFGQDWPDSLSGGSWIAKFRADDGTLAWKTGTKNLHNLVGEAPARTGTLCEPTQFCGEINGCIVVADRIGTPALAYTLDGICVGQFLDDRTSDGRPDAVYKWWDSQNWPHRRLSANSLLMDQQTPFQYDMLKGGTVAPGSSADEILWLHHGRNNTPVYSVAGWNGWVTQDAPLVLNRNPVAFTGTGLTAKYYPNANWTGTPATRLDSDLRMWFMRNRGAFSASTSYLPGDVVSSAGAYYFCIQNSDAVPVTNAGRWYRLDPRLVNPAGNGWYRAVNAPGIANYGNFSVTWRGALVPFHTGTHWFTWEGDAAEVWINGAKVIDLSNRYGQPMNAEWADCGQKFFHKVSTPVELVSGRAVSIEIKLRVSSPVTNWRRGHPLYQEGFSPRAALFWATEGFSARLIESKYLRPTGPMSSAPPAEATTASTSSGINVQWALPADGETYQVWRGVDDDPEHSALITTTTAHEFTDTAPPAPARVIYWIRSSAGELLAVSSPVITSGTAAAPAEVLNLSARGAVDSAHPMIMGFVIGGDSPQDVLLRAVGPGLTVFGVPGTLLDPRVELHSMENSTATLLSATTAWRLEPNISEITAAFTRTGAFPLATDSPDAATLRQFAPGIYTAVVSDTNQRPGVGLVEIYLANPSGTGGTTRRFRNLSARGLAADGTGALIGGISISGTRPQRLLVRGLGPALDQVGVADAMAHPLLRVFGRDQEQPLIENAGWWMDDGILVSALRNAEAATGALALADGTDDAAVLVELTPGTYTVHLVPAAGTAPGNALLEFYALDP